MRRCAVPLLVVGLSACSRYESMTEPVPDAGGTTTTEGGTTDAGDAATCPEGTCAAEKVRENILRLGGFAVESDTTVYFTSGPLVNSCPADQCMGTPTKLADTSPYDALAIEVGNSYVNFVSSVSQGGVRPVLFRCPVSGCGGSPQSIVSDLSGIGSFRATGNYVYGVLSGTGLYEANCKSTPCTSAVLRVPKPVGVFALDDANIYFQDVKGTSFLGKCPLPEAPCVTRTALSTTVVKSSIVVAQNLVMFIGPGIAGSDAVYACPKTTCTSPTAVARRTGSITGLAADEGGIYWLNDGKVAMCADVACTGGAKQVAVAPGAANLRLTPRYVYFTVPGANMDESTLMRAPRP